MDGNADAASKGAVMRALDLILSRLLAVRRLSTGRFTAKCPAHEDHSPSLAIRLSDDRQRVLMFCHARCETSAIVAAIGLSLQDLFDGSQRTKRNPVTDRRRLAAAGLENWHQFELRRCA